jgi:hypothetical protein
LLNEKLNLRSGRKLARGERLRSGIGIYLPIRILV